VNLTIYFVGLLLIDSSNIISMLVIYRMFGELNLQENLHAISPVDLFYLFLCTSKLILPVP
jgi:hypothetical protein